MNDLRKYVCIANNGKYLDKKYFLKIKDAVLQDLGIFDINEYGENFSPDECYKAFFVVMKIYAPKVLSRLLINNGAAIQHFSRSGDEVKRIVKEIQKFKQTV